MTNVPDGKNSDSFESRDPQVLQAEIMRLRKVVASLSSRVEKSLESNSSAFAIFERNIVLNDLVRSRTVDLEKLTESLKEERSKLSSIVSAVPGLILAFHRDGTVLESLIGSGQNLDQVLNCRHFDDLPKSFHEIFEQKRSQIEGGIPQFVRFKVSDRWLAASCSRTGEGNGTNGMVIHFTDVTDQALNEEIILEQRAKISDAAKFSSLGVMAGGVAHEINNPLAIISGKAQGVLRKLGRENLKPTDLGTDIEVIVKTVDRIARIVRGLRAVSRSGQSDPFEPADLREIVEDSVSLCRERFNASGIEFRVNEVPSIKIRCRPTQIAQVMINLLNNAYDAAESAEAGKWIEIDFSERNGFVEIHVMDSGHGVAVEHRDRIMTPFFTTKEVGKGTGLGLSISNSIVRDHGGVLEYDTKASNTCFKLCLPVSQPGDASAGADRK
ncbi:MAG: ATP-binding protein [Bdellovibrionales bacterium]|nr:ATP-binding protein [Bdellovibrionales bacterium]